MYAAFANRSSKRTLPHRAQVRNTCTQTSSPKLGNAHKLATARSSLATRAAGPLRAQSKKQERVKQKVPLSMHQTIHHQQKMAHSRQAASSHHGPGLAIGSSTTLDSSHQPVTEWLEDLRKEALKDATWKKGKLFVDLFSGQNSPLSQNVKARGGACIAFDVLIDARFDLSQPDVELTLMRWIRSGAVWAVFLGTDCTTWCTASYSKGPGWFNSYRSKTNLWGDLGALSPKAQVKLLQGNAHAKFTIRVLSAIAQQPSTAGGLENPRGSVIWKIPELQALGQHSRCYETVCHYCQYGTQWKKPTSLFFVGGQKARAPAKLCTGGKRCSRTKKPHLTLGQGRCHPSSGRLLTRLATEYPKALAAQIVECLAG